MLNTAALLLLFIVSASQFDDVAARAAKARDAENLDEAVTLYRQAVHLRPDWAEGWWYLGTLAYDRKQFPAAVAALSKVVALTHNDANAYAMLGLSEAQLQQNKSALSHLEQALKLGLGEDANMRQVVVFTQGNLYVEEGAFWRGQDTLDNLALERPEANEEMTMALGRAVMGIRPSATLTPEMRDLLMTAGQAEFFAARREVSQATEAYANFVKKFPTTHNVQFAYGRFLLKYHLDDQAVAAFRKEIENDPQHLLARLGIAGALLLTDPAGGLPYAEQATKLAPKMAEAHFLYGSCLLATEQTERAITELETARRLSPNDSRIYFPLARAYARMNRTADAAAAREKFRELSKPITK